MTRIRRVIQNKKQYLDLLLLGDEQEDMIGRYLEGGEMYVLEESSPLSERMGGSGESDLPLVTSGRALAVCVVTDEGGGVLELKNLAVRPEEQRKGYGRRMLRFLEENFSDRYKILQVGTGESPATLHFYEKCGFQISHRIPDFFTENYDHPIVDQGVLLRDMVYLRKRLQ